MQHVSLWLVREDASAASIALAESGVFNPDAADGFRLQLPDVAEQRFREVYLAARSRLDKILAHFGREARATVPAVPQAVALPELEALDTRLAQVWQGCFESEERVRGLEEERTRVRQLLATLDTFARLDLDLGHLLSEHRFLDVRLGTVPSANLPRLREALSLAGGLISSFASAQGLEHCVAVGPMARATETAALLHTAGWHALDVPAELRTHPEAARAALEHRLASAERALAAELAGRAQRADGLAAEIDEAANRLLLAAPFAAVIEHSTRARGGLVLITGWVPQRDVAPLEALLRSRLPRPFLLRARDPAPGERPQVPTVVRHPALLRSFAGLVRTYGVPRYGEVDPTLLFAVTFVLMFGMMFGDVGQGAVLAVGALALRGRLVPARMLVVACGVSSVVFGFLYGSLFGYEHVLHPVWMSPLSDPLRMLAVAVFWGIAFIVVASLIRAWNLYASRGIAAALLDAGGVAGIVMYLGAVLAVAGWLGYGVPGWIGGALMAGGAAAILVHTFHEQQGPLAERALVSAIETFEAAIGYFANTLSFMRLGAFSLNHVALALAVFTVANMLGGVGHWIAVVLGNVFILVLEGAIVAIQALRLEYYEGFSRFFSGDGREWHPLVLRTPRNSH